MTPYNQAVYEAKLMRRVRAIAGRDPKPAVQPGDWRERYLSWLKNGQDQRYYPLSVWGPDDHESV